MTCSVLLLMTAEVEENVLQALSELSVILFRL